MLQRIRDVAQGWIAWLIVIALSIPFALWGIQEYSGVGSDPVAARVGDIEIKQSELNRSADQVRNQLANEFGGNLPPSITNALIRQRAVERLLNDKAMDQQLASLGIRASDQMIQESILNDELFQEDGVFSKNAYKRMLTINGYTPARYQELLRADLSDDILRKSITDTDFVTETEARELLGFQKQHRKISWLQINGSKAVAEPEVSDDEIKDYYEKNLNRFPKLEQVKVEYILLDLEAIAKNIQIADEKIKEFYNDDKNQQDLINEGERFFSHILIKVDETKPDEEAKQLAQALLDDIRAGADFASMALTHSDDQASAENGGYLGEIEAGTMVKPFEDAAFSLRAGEISELVKTQFGYHIIKAREGELKSLDKLEETIRAKLQRIEAEKDFGSKYDQLQNLAYDHPDTLAPASEALSIKVITSDWINRQTDSRPFDNTKAREEALSKTAINDRRNSSVIELGDDRYIVFRVIAHEPRSNRPIEDVKNTISQLIKNDIRAKGVGALAEEILQSLKEGKSFDELTSEFVTKTDEKIISRDDTTVNKNIISQAFNMPGPKKNNPRFARVSLGGPDFALIKLSEVIDADQSMTTEEELKAVQQELRERRGNQSFGAYLEILKTELGASTAAPTQ